MARVEQFALQSVLEIRVSNALNHFGIHFGKRIYFLWHFLAASLVLELFKWINELFWPNAWQDRARI